MPIFRAKHDLYFLYLSEQRFLSMENEVLDQPVPAEGEYNFDQKVSHLIANGYQFRIGDYLSAGHKILMRHLGSFIGYLLIFFIISIVLSVIPFAGSIINFIIGNALFMGFSIVARKIFFNKPF